MESMLAPTEHYLDQTRGTSNILPAEFPVVNGEGFGLSADGRPVVDLFVGWERLMVLEKGKPPGSFGGNSGANRGCQCDVTRPEQGTPKELV